MSYLAEFRFGVGPAAIVGAGVGAALGEGLVTGLDRGAERHLANVNIATVSALGQVRGPGRVEGTAIGEATETLVGLLRTETKWILIDGESGLGKTTLARKALADHRLRTMSGKSAADPLKIEVDFDSIECTHADTARLMRDHFDVETDPRLKQLFVTNRCIVVLDHLERFVKDGSVAELDAIINWFDEIDGPITVIAIVQGHQIASLSSLQNRSPALVELNRLSQRDSIAVFEAFAPSTVGLSQVGDVVEPFRGLPRAIRLLAMAAQTQITDPYGTRPARDVLTDFASLVASYDASEAAVEPGGGLYKPRDLSLDTAMRLVFDTSAGQHKHVRSLLVQLAQLPSGMARGHAPEVLHVPGSLPRAAIPSSIGRAYTAGLVHSTPAGIAAEPAAVIYLRTNDDSRVPDSRTKANWCSYASGASSISFVDANRLNLQTAIDENWPESTQVALSLVRQGLTTLGEDQLIDHAAHSESAIIEASLEWVAQQPTGPHLELCRALVQEVLAISIESEDPGQASSLMNEAFRFHDRPLVTGGAALPKAEHRSLRTLFRRLCLAKRTDDISDQAAILRLLGWLAAHRNTYNTDRYANNNQAAQDHYNQALPLAKQANNISGEAETLRLLGWLAANQNTYNTNKYANNNQAAQDHYNQALPLAKQANNIWEEAETLRLLGWLAAHRNTYNTNKYANNNQAAQDHYNQALPLAKQANNISAEAAILRLLGWLAANQNTYNTNKYANNNQAAQDHYNQALPLAKQANNIWEEAAILRLLGWLAAHRNTYNTNKYANNNQAAQDHYNQALPLAKQANNIWEEAETLRLLGWLAANQNTYNTNKYANNNQAAQDHYNQALPLAKQANNISGEAAILRLLGWLAAHRNTYNTNKYANNNQAAQDHYNQALPLAKQANNIWEEAETLRLLGWLAANRNTYNTNKYANNNQAAQDHYNQALPLAKQANDQEVLQNLEEFRRGAGLEDFEASDPPQT